MDRRSRRSSGRKGAPFLVALVSALALLLQVAVTPASAAALTAIIEPKARLCFYAWVDKVGEKIGFYFAVQAGGDFDIDYDVISPSDKHIVSGVKERQLDIVFTGNEIGEYSFCFENDHTRLEQKKIDFDITVESEPRLELPLNKQELLSKSSAPLEESITKVGSWLTQINRMQRYFRTWENRGFATVRGTQSKLFWYGVFQTLITISIAIGQVYFVRWLFDKGSTKRYRV